MKRFSFIGAGLFAVLLIGYILYQGEEGSENIRTGLNDIQDAFTGERELQPEVVSYGIEAETDFYICTEKIQQNENVSSILSRYDMAPEVIHELATKSQGVFDLRSIRAGRSYCIMRETDSTEQVRYFVYEQDPVNYVVYEFGDSVTIRKGKKEVEIRRRYASGRIQSSLWETLVKNDLDPNLAVRMSEVYAWSIDFYRIQKDDWFRVIFDEKFVDGEKVGFGTVHAAWFRHANRDFYAILYEQDSIETYFDEQANSLRKAFLKAPLKYSRISSRYNLRRFHPVLKRVKAHLGTDYAAPTGTPIHAVGDGMVTEAQYKSNNGNYVKIRHNGTYTTQYLHMSKIEPGVRSGVYVRQGEVIGYVGQTGLATGPHLCYRFWKNGKQVDPFAEEIPPSEPISEDCMASYVQYRDQMLRHLESIPLPFHEGDEPEGNALP